MQNGDSSLLPQVSDSNMGMEHGDDVQEGSKDAFVDYDEEMAEAEFENYDDESETIDSISNQAEDVDVSRVLIGGRGTRVRYKVQKLKACFLACIRGLYTCGFRWYIYLLYVCFCYNSWFAIR